MSPRSVENSRGRRADVFGCGCGRSYLLSVGARVSVRLKDLDREIFDEEILRPQLDLEEFGAEGRSDIS